MLDIDMLWDRHPANNGSINPCSSDDEPHFENQCAIRLSVCLQECGVDFEGYDGVRCWHGCDQVHALRVEELVIYMRKHLEVVLGEYQEFPRPRSSMFEDASGIIVCFNFWNNGNGDHIDILRDGEMTYGDLEYVDRSERVGFWHL